MPDARCHAQAAIFVWMVAEVRQNIAECATVHLHNVQSVDGCSGLVSNAAEANHHARFEVNFDVLK